MYLTKQIHRESTKDGAELTAGGEYGLYMLFDDCVHITAVGRPLVAGGQVQSRY
jgi:hypothetical protein